MMDKNKIETVVYPAKEPDSSKGNQQSEPLYKSGKIHQEAFGQNGLLKPAKKSKLPASCPEDEYPPISDVYLDAPPIVPEGAFPPCLQSAVDVACNGTEAHPMAVALHYIAYFGAHVGQQRFIMIGNERHNLNIFGILAGQTGRVKGVAESQAVFIEHKACEILQDKYGYIPPRRLSGLSSGEGLIQSLKDPDEKDDCDNRVLDKRLMITESEYANVLTQDQRNGNNLSTVLRDAYDGKDLANMTVTPRTASCPHICCIGHITPSELIGHKSFATQSKNGSLNRNLIFFGKRPLKKANPRAYSKTEIKDLSQWFAEIVIIARDGAIQDDFRNKKAGREMIFSPEAIALIEEEYETRELEQERMPELLANLVSRQRVNLRRLSAIFALMDRENTIQRSHVEQAYLCLDYSTDSIRYLLKTAKQEVEQAQVTSFSEQVYEAISLINCGQGCNLTELHKHFNGRQKGSKLTAALQALLESAPPKIERYHPKKSGAGRKPTMFRVIPEKKSN